MAILINSNTAIDDSRNFYLRSITFTDSSSQNTAAVSTVINDFSTLNGLEKLASSNNVIFPSYSTINKPFNFVINDVEFFGQGIAVSSSEIAIGCTNEDSASGLNSGVVYIFNSSTGALLRTITNPNAYSTGTEDRFGISLALDGTNLLVGSQEADASGTTSGKAYLFNTTNGALLQTFNNPNAYSTSAGDIFSVWGVGLSLNYAIISAIGEDEATGSFSGKVYVFTASTGALLYTLNNPNNYSTPTNDAFGRSVAISGNYAIVGASGEDDLGSGGISSGVVHVFDLTTGLLLRTITNPNAYSTSQFDDFGYYVSLEGTNALISAYQEDDSSGTASGKVYHFDALTGSLIRTFDNPNPFGTSSSDLFGHSVAISNTVAVIGAYGEDDSGGLSSGKAYIYSVSNGALLYTINNPNSFSTSNGDFFASRVAVSSTNTVVVSANLEDRLGFENAGVVYAFTANNGTLTQTISNPNSYTVTEDSNFGRAVAISGKYAIIGAPQDPTDASTGLNGGRAFIFNVASGEVIATLTNPGAYSTAADDNFGRSVDISGNFAIVGTPNEDDATGTNSGRAFIYNATSGKLDITLTNPNAYSTTQADNFGASVSIDGPANRALVGAPQEADSSGINSGKAYLFNATTGALLQTFNNPSAYSTGASDFFGDPVKVSGDYCIVGAPGEADAGGSSSGKVYVFNGNSGSLLYTLNNPNAYGTSFLDSFGFSVDTDGRYIIVGAPLEDESGGSSSGKAYIFNILSGALVQTLNNPNAYSTPVSDQFGWSVGIYGNYAVVGAYTEDDSGGAGSGKAYVFDVNTGTFLFTLDNPNAYSTGAADNFGRSVGISGEFVIVGADLEDDVNGNAGKVYVFNITKNSLEDKLVSLFN